MISQVTYSSESPIQTALIPSGIAAVTQLVHFNDDVIVFHLCYVNTITNIYILMTNTNTYA